MSIATQVRTMIACLFFTLVPGVAKHAESAPPPMPADQPAETSDSTPQEKPKWHKLFDGKTLVNWKPTKFGGEGDTEVKSGELHLGFGSSLTGVTYAGQQKLPTTNYEIRLEAQRVDGSDFFCGLTLPYDDSHFSLIVGGWGGGVVGISSLDEFDASENETTVYVPFKKGVWYKIRVRVTPGKIQAWIDDKQEVDVEVGDRKVSTRIEVDLSKPLGIASYETHAALRNIELRELPEPR